MELNGQRLELEQTQEQIEYFEKFAEGLVSREQMAQTYRDNCRPIEREKDSGQSQRDVELDRDEDIEIDF